MTDLSTERVDTTPAPDVLIRLVNRLSGPLGLMSGGNHEELGRCLRTWHGPAGKGLFDPTSCVEVRYNSDSQCLQVSAPSELIDTVRPLVAGFAASSGQPIAVFVHS